MVQSDRAVVFMTSQLVDETSDHVPANVRVYLKRNGVLTKYVVILNISQERVPFIGQKDRYRTFDFGAGIIGVQARYGFMQQPNAGVIIRQLEDRNLLPTFIHRCTIEIGEEELIIHPNASLKDRVFAHVFQFLLRVTVPAHRYFGLNAISGLAKTLIPVSIDKEGVRVEIPEFALDRREEAAGIDPDTLKPTEVPYTKPKDD
jgi:KUP system potassium uptake protein